MGCNFVNLPSKHSGSWNVALIPSTSHTRHSRKPTSHPGFWLKAFSRTPYTWLGVRRVRLGEQRENPPEFTLACISPRTSLCVEPCDFVAISIHRRQPPNAKSTFASILAAATTIASWRNSSSPIYRPDPLAVMSLSADNETVAATRATQDTATPRRHAVTVAEEHHGHLHGLQLYNLLGALMLAMLLLGLDINIVATVRIVARLHPPFADGMPPSSLPRPSPPSPTASIASPTSTGMARPSCSPCKSEFWRPHAPLDRTFMLKQPGTS